MTPKPNSKLSGRWGHGVTAETRTAKSGTLALVLADNVFKRRMGCKPKMSQLQLAAESGLSPNAVAKIEKAVVDTSLSSIEALAPAFKVQPYELLKP